MYLVTVDRLTASHSSHEVYTDDGGTDWICTKITGWNEAPGRRTSHTERDTADGAHRAAAYRQTRVVELAGRFFPPSDLVGHQLSRLVTSLCRLPGERYPLTVQEADLALVAYVEQGGAILCDQTGPLQWDWSIPLVAADPSRYGSTWVSVASQDPVPGVGGIDFTNPGPSFAAPGLDMGTAATPAEAQVQGLGTDDSLLVVQVEGATSGVWVSDLGGPAMIGVRGEVAQGESVFVNCSGRVAYDVPGCAVPIPAYGAVNGTANARGAVSVSGGWPTVGPGEARTFRLTGALGTGAGLVVHTRGTWT